MISVFVFIFSIYFFMMKNTLISAQLRLLFFLFDYLSFA